MNYKVIDKSKYYRAGVYKHFTKDCKCSVSITNKLDVTNIVKYSKVTNTKFYINFLYVLTKTLNSREDYKMAFDANDWKRTDRIDDKFYNMDDYKQWNNTDTKTNRDSNINTVSHGLTGVYSNQKLIEEELKLRTKYNVYDYISDLFYEEFMIKCM